LIKKDPYTPKLAVPLKLSDLICAYQALLYVAAPSHGASSRNSRRDSRLRREWERVSQKELDSQPGASPPHGVPAKGSMRCCSYKRRSPSNHVEFGSNKAL